MINNRKKKITAVLLSMLLGMFGAHRFYLGYKKQGRFQLAAPILALLLSVGSTIVLNIWGYRNRLVTLIELGSIAVGLYALAMYIWAFVDFIRILLNKLLPADGQDYIYMDGPLSLTTRKLPDSFAAADSGVVMIDRLFALYKKGAITLAQYNETREKFSSRM